jgi:hypothetical protein
LPPAPQTVAAAEGARNLFRRREEMRAPQRNEFRAPVRVPGYALFLEPVRKSLYIPFLRSNALNSIMDALVSILAMPFGVFLCFGPAVLVWYLTDRKNKAAEKPLEQSKSIRP